MLFSLPVEVVNLPDSSTCSYPSGIFAASSSLNSLGEDCKGRRDRLMIEELPYSAPANWMIRSSPCPLPRNLAQAPCTADMVRVGTRQRLAKARVVRPFGLALRSGTCGTLCPARAPCPPRSPCGARAPSWTSSPLELLTMPLAGPTTCLCRQEEPFILKPRTAALDPALLDDVLSRLPASTAGRSSDAAKAFPLPCAEASHPKVRKQRPDTQTTQTSTISVSPRVFQIPRRALHRLLGDPQPRCDLADVQLDSYFFSLGLGERCGSAVCLVTVPFYII